MAKVNFFKKYRAVHFTNQAFNKKKYAKIFYLLGSVIAKIISITFCYQNGLYGPTEKAMHPKTFPKCKQILKVSYPLNIIHQNM